MKMYHFIHQRSLAIQLTMFYLEHKNQALMAYGIIFIIIFISGYQRGTKSHRMGHHKTAKRKL